MSDAPDTLTLPRLTTPRVVGGMMIREMATTYGRSPGGYIWALIEPIGMIFILAYGFSLLVRSPSLGDSFLLFYATGYLPFTLYAKSAQKLGTTLSFSSSLLSYPRVVWVDALFARYLLHTLTALAAACIVMSLILMFLDIQAILDLGPIFVGFASCALLGFGVGTMNCFLIGMFPVWKNVWKIISRPLFLASGIIFLYDDMPSFAQSILWWNPLIHGVGITRTGFYPTYGADYVSLPFVFGVGLTLTAAGLLFLSAYHNRILEK